MKLKWFNAKNCKKKINKQTLYMLALREACIELCLQGNFNTYEAARIAMITRAKKNYQV